MLIKVKSLLPAVLLVMAPVGAASARSVAPDVPAVPEFGTIRSHVVGTRLAGSSYWEIDGNENGVVSTPAIFGYNLLSPLAKGLAYPIAPGEHRVEIGKDGFRALREFLEPIIDLKPVPGAPLTQEDCWSACDIGTKQLSWAGDVAGSLTLPNDGLTSHGKIMKERMDGSWFVTARAADMAQHTDVSVVEVEELPKPRRLSVTEKGIWNPYTIQWEIDSEGKGWIEFSDKLTLRGSDPLKGSVSVDARRYGFQLDHAFHQAILREFAPYMGEAPKSGSCEDEITTSDQPVVRIEWENAAGQKVIYQSDLGCPSFASRAGRVKAMFAELLGNGNLGEATLLWGSQAGTFEHRPVVGIRLLGQARYLF